MIIHKATYIISSPDTASCPKPDRPEYAFIGRSNVGKSSLINMITGTKNLAKTSSTPGKTQLINHFAIDSKAKDNASMFHWYLVDLPGYGFAKVSASQRKKWEKMIEGFLRTRETLVNVFALIDARHSPQQIDLDFVNKLGEWQVPFSIVFTKSDKETQKVVSANVKAFTDAMRARWAELPSIFVTSAEKRTGRTPLLSLINTLNDAAKEEIKKPQA
jgi:GTP-binding protein